MVRLIRFGTCNYILRAHTESKWEGGEDATHHEPDLFGDCAFFDACMRHIKMLFFWYSNIYACITHVHTYVWGTYIHAVVVFGHSPSLGYNRWPIYSWAHVDVHHFDQQRERARVPGWILLLLVRVTIQSYVDHDDIQTYVRGLAYT